MMAYTGRVVLEATNENWGLIGPGNWSVRTWKIREDGLFSFSVSYVGTEPDREWEGILDPEDYARLAELINEAWSDREVRACDGEAWEFRAYGSEDEVIRERPLGYICGVEPFESMAAILRKYKARIRF